VYTDEFSNYLCCQVSLKLFVLFSDEFTVSSYFFFKDLFKKYLNFPLQEKFEFDELLQFFAIVIRKKKKFMCF
jgi:hypothetical protein